LKNQKRSIVGKERLFSGEGVESMKGGGAGTRFPDVARKRFKPGRTNLGKKAQSMSSNARQNTSGRTEVGGESGRAI